MTEIERLISRYLDGELSPSEQTRLRKLLVESPDARALLREMTVLGRAARRTPALYAPNQGMEDRLFRRLRAEGLQAGGSSLPEVVADRSVSVAGAPTFMTRLRQTALVMAMFVAVIGGGYLFNDHMSPSVPLQASSTAPLPTPSLAHRGAEIEAPEVIVNPYAAVSASHERRAVSRRSLGRGIRSAGTSEVAPVPEQNIAESDIPPASSNEGTISPTRSYGHILADRPDPPPVMDLPPVSIPAAERGNGWMASFRGGIASVGFDREQVQEINLRIGVQMNEGHQIVMMIGNGPTLAETRHENTGIGMSAPASSQIPTNGRMFELEPGLPEYERTLNNETWLGVGYNYSVSVTEAISIDPGVSAGIGGTNWRVGIEVPVRYRIAGHVSMECAFSATRVQPHDPGADEFTDYSAADHFIYEGSKQQAGFNSLGVQVGVRVDLAGNR